MKFLVVDIECKNWNEILGIGLYDGITYKFFESVHDFFCYVKTELHDCCIYAHNGGKYDFPFLLDWLLPFDSKPREIPEDFLLINGSIITFTVFDKVQFRDSLAIMPGSLKKIAPLFNQKKMEMDYDDIESHDWKTYLENDCIITWKILYNYFEYVDENFKTSVGITLASPQ